MHNLEVNGSISHISIQFGCFTTETGCFGYGSTFVCQY